ncbi:MurR/RpiR family transcriptional regulator [Cobetia sp. 1AS1]|uniref:MurR/RpiR family transcriptional regulator n=1 Tax=Cobetia sp. 1AS1 TaxID=3040016 RepID=UPI0024488F5E|nr:MurR/RpiR family transcriptional regulator [Cobetia sp. 1AS1]MDH2293490.1 MurR/RpiR family transcriptional regulator [Cobetia sp. 1AS1]
MPDPNSLQRAARQLQTFEALEAHIGEQYPELSKRLQQSARFLLDHPQEVAFGTVAALADKAGVTPSTMIRFANALGFSGFSEMQKLFRSRLVEAEPDYNERIRVAREVTGTSPSVNELLMNFAEANLQALAQLPHRVPTQDIERALDLMQAAEAIHLLGARRSFVVSSYLAYSLRHVAKRAFLMDGMGAMYREQAEAVSERDCLLVTSFAPYAEEVQNAVRSVRERGVPIILITDSSLSPLTRQADVALVVNEAEVQGFRGLTSTLCLAQVLAIGLGVRNEANMATDSQKLQIEN